MKKIYNKLVRDKIPKIIEADGKSCSVLRLANDEYSSSLEAKLDEEISEYHSDKNVEELADILEVVYALAQLHGVDPAGLEKIRNDKSAQRGGFSDRIFLVSVEDLDTCR